MDLTADLLDLQAEAESRMTDTCTVTRAAAGAGTFDPDTGKYTGATTQVYTGQCRLRVPGTVSASRERLSAGDTAVMSTTILSVPMGSAKLLVGDRVEVTASLSPHLVGQVWSVDGLIMGSQQTAQKVSLTVVVD